MLGSNNVLLTASLLAKLSLGVSSDWESAAQAAGLRGAKWSSAAFFSVRCLVTMSCRNAGPSQGGRQISLTSCTTAPSCKSVPLQLHYMFRIKLSFSLLDVVVHLQCLQLSLSCKDSQLSFQKCALRCCCNCLGRSQIPPGAEISARLYQVWSFTTTTTAIDYV